MSYSDQMQLRLKRHLGTALTHEYKTRRSLFNCKVTQSITKYDQFFSFCVTNSELLTGVNFKIYTLGYSAHQSWVYLGSIGHLSRTFTTLNLLGVWITYIVSSCLALWHIYLNQFGASLAQTRRSSAVILINSKHDLLWVTITTYITLMH